MNREEIIRMAHEAWLCDHNGDDDNSIDISSHLEQFAKLVVANIDLKSSMTWQEGYEAGVVAEREACAKIADRQLHNMNALLVYPMQSSAAYEIGCAIRARGKE